MEEADRLPKLVAVFTDRTAASWDTARAEDIKKLRETLPDPKPSHIVFDVGAEHPTERRHPGRGDEAAGALRQSAGGRDRDRRRDRPDDGTGRGGRHHGDARWDRRDAQTRDAPLWPVAVGHFPVRQVEAGPSPGGVQPGDQRQADVQQLALSHLQGRRGAAHPDHRRKRGGCRQLAKRAHTGKDGFGCLVVKPDDVRIENGRTVVRYPNPRTPRARPRKTTFAVSTSSACWAFAIRATRQAASIRSGTRFGPTFRAAASCSLFPAENRSRRKATRPAGT